MDGLNINVVTSDQGSSRSRYRNLKVLEEDGKNYLCWRAIMPAYFQSELYAWEVIVGDIDPLKPEEKPKYEIGNKNGRTLLFEAVDNNLMWQMFSGETEFVTAKDIWDKIHLKMVGQTGVFKDQAVERYTTFKFDPNASVTTNVRKFKSLVFKLEAVGAGVSTQSACARLICALPRSWEPFKQAWSVKTDTEKNITTLIELITAEDARRQFEEGDEVTAYAARAGGQRKKKPQKSEPCFHFEDTKKSQSSSSRDVVVCWNCNKKGHLMKDCYFLKNKNPPKKGKGKGKPSANLVQVYMTDVSMQEAGKLKVNEKTMFIVDSGSTHNILNKRCYYTPFEPYEQSREVRLGDSRSLKALGEGTALITVQNGTNRVSIMLEQALLVPEMKNNLISVTQLLDDSFRVVTTRNTMKLVKGKQKISANREAGLFVLRAEEGTSSVSLQMSRNHVISLKEAHKILAHVNKQKVKEVLQKAGIHFVDDFEDCVACFQGKKHKSSYRTNSESARASTLGVIHTDLCMLSPKSLGVSSYFMCMTDEYSKFRKVYFLKRKSESAGYIQAYTDWFRNQTGKGIKRLHTDRGLEFLNRDVEELITKIGAEHTYSCARRPQQNGLSGRTNRTLVELARTLLIDTNLNRTLWSEAVAFCSQVLNAITINKAENKSAYELIYGKRPHLGRFHAFGPECYFLDDRPDRKKLEPKSIRGIMTGFSEESKGYRVWIPGTRTIAISNDVVFPKTSILMESDQHHEEDPELVEISEDNENISDNVNDDDNQDPTNNANVDNINDENSVQTGERDESTTEEPKESSPQENSEDWVVLSAVTRDKREEKSTQGVVSKSTIKTASVTSDDTEEPSTYEEAMQSKHKKEWIQAMNEVLQSLESLNVWTLMELPEGQRCFWKN